MKTTIQVRPGYRMSWAPAPTRQLPSPYGHRLGQGGLEAFAASPALALVTDVVLVASAGYLAWGIGTATRYAAVEARKAGRAVVAENPWSTFWWIVAAAGTIKGLHDLSRVSVNRA